MFGPGQWPCGMSGLAFGLLPTSLLWGVLKGPLKDARAGVMQPETACKSVAFCWGIQRGGPGEMRGPREGRLEKRRGPREGTQKKGRGPKDGVTVSASDCGLFPHLEIDSSSERQAQPQLSSCAQGAKTDLGPHETPDEVPGTLAEELGCFLQFVLTRDTLLCFPLPELGLF